MTRVFRIERPHTGATENEAQNVSAPNDNSAILAALHDIQAMLRDGATAGANSVPDNSFLERYRADITEANKLKAELDSIQSAIEKTKTEIATLRYTGLDGDEGSRVTDELGAVVQGTEVATETILAAAEVIDENAGNLSAKLNGDDQGMASDIQEQVVKIFEACNFQDLSGQRITKVVTAMRFIEERVDRMMSIWGGIESFSNIEPEKHGAKTGDDAFLHGPPLETDEGLASQDDIDALFD